jgi:hypothetical protein
LQLETDIESFAFTAHGKLLNGWIFHLSRCPGKVDHYIIRA